MLQLSISLPRVWTCVNSNAEKGMISWSRSFRIQWNLACDSVDFCVMVMSITAWRSSAVLFLGCCNVTPVDELVPGG